MKKHVKRSLVSLILCATMSCVIGAFAAMSSFKAKAEAEYQTLEHFTIKEEAAVRTKDFNGIRFKTEISGEAKAEIDSLNLSNAQYGTLILPADFLGSEELTHDTAKVVDIKTTKWQDETTYTSVLAGKVDAKGNYTSLPESYYNRPLAARSYVKGENGVTYYSKNTAVRSIGYVAYMAKLGGQTTDLINYIVSKTDVELVFTDERISALQNLASGTTVIENAIPQSTTMAAVVMVGGIPVPANMVGAITYTSNASDVISVNGETLTALKEGSATITASVTFGDKELTASKVVSTDCYEAKSDYKILISAEAESGQTNAGTVYLPAQSEAAHLAYNKAYEKTAAYKLQEVLEQATGLKLPIVTATGEAGVKYISVGETTLASSVNVSTLGATDAKVAVDTNGNVIIRGATAAGTLYGVQRWLGDLVGYEYYTNNNYVVNDKVELVALSEAKTYTRDITYNVTQTENLDYHAGYDTLDGYGMRSYTETIIPVGTTDEEDGNGFYYKGIAHNSVLVANGEGIAYGLTESNYKYKGSNYRYWYATQDNNYYHIINNPYYDAGSEDKAKNSETIAAELCYTAHGYAEDQTNGRKGRSSLVEAVASAMYAKMQKFPEYDRIGFAQMDHTIWCECSSCTGHGNASANLLEFLLDVAKNLKAKLGSDPRAETFQICTLFYHKSNPNPIWTTEPTDKLTNYMKHIEVWFAETGADQIDPYNLDDTTAATVAANNNGNDWNKTVYGYMSAWANLCNTYGSDMLWWGYYANSQSQFIPFNTIDAMRANYATAKALGVDTMFNQMMTFQTNWSSLKYYLMSKLTVNATPNDTEWNGWLDSYFEGAYGQGSEQMQNYFNAWNTLTNSDTVKNRFRREKTYAAYQADKSVSEAAMGAEARGFTINVSGNALLGYNASVGWDSTWTNLWKTTDLTAWIGYCDAALAALDATDPNYETYYKNIMLEKLVPMYLLMFVHDTYVPVLKAMNNSGWYVVDYSQDGAFTTTTYVEQYGAEFLTWANELKITTDGEGRSLTPFLNAIKSKGEAAYTSTIVSDLIVAEKGKSVTLSSAALTAGDYTVSGTLTTATSATVSTAGQVTVAVGSLTVGDTYSVTFTNKQTKDTVTFDNVVVTTAALAGNAGAVSGTNGYYVIDKTYYIEEGTTDIWLTHDVLQKGTYTVTVDGSSTQSTIYAAGKLKITLSNMFNGTEREVIVVDSNNNTYVFNVVGVTYIRTVEELQALGVGGGIETTGDLRDFGGRGNSFEAGNDVTGYYVLANDLDAAGYYFAAGYFGHQSYFKGTFDGNGHTIYNAIVSEGGIFGGISGATIRNVNFVNLEYHGNGAPLPATQTSNLSGNGYNNTTQYGQQMGLIAQFAASSTIENINVQVTALKTTGDYGHMSGSIVYSTAGGNNTFSNINIDASGLAFNNVLGRELSGNVTFSNVTIKAASYSVIGYADGGTTPTPLAGWPTGVNFTTVESLNNNYVTSIADKGVAGTSLPVYTGDVTALGFKEGTIVQYAVQDNRTNMWEPGTNLGLTMEKQGVRLAKALDEEYASIQFSISRAFTGTYAFFTWWYNSDGTNMGGGGYLKADGTYSGGSLNAAAFDLETGDLATSFVPGKVYELRWYAEEAIAFKLSCCEQNGESITIYYTNPSSGNEDILTNRATVEISESVTTTEADGVATATFETTGETTLDVSAVTEIVGNKPVTMWLSGNVIYEGTLNDTLALDASLFANSGNNNILIRYDGGCVHLPIYVSKNIELNQENAGSVLKLEAILETNPDGQYVLTSNLDMGGNALKGVETFNGVLDGNGYMITNTSLKHGANVDMGYAPVFIKNNYGTIKNIGFDLSDFGWQVGSIVRGITSYNYGTLSNVYLKVSLNTALNSGSNESISGDAPDLGKFNAVGILGRENAGLVENCIVDITASVELDNYSVAALFYKNRANAQINNSYAITKVDVIAPIWIDHGTSNNATKYASFSAVKNLITPSNGWNAVWTVETDGSVYFGSENIYQDSSQAGATISATDNPSEFTEYTGDVTTLGFAAGTQANEAQISDGWASRVRITPDDAEADYVSFDFAVSSNVTSFTLWPSSGGSYSINANGINIHEPGKTDTIKIIVYDQNGNFVDNGPWVPGTVYTLRLYLQGENARVTDFTFSTFETGRSLYFANAHCGYVAVMNDIIELGDGEFTLPDGIQGTVQGATLNGTSIFNSVSGNTVTLNDEAAQIKAADLGRDKTLIIVTDQARYVFETTAVTKVIMTADDIFALGVGGNATTGLIRNSHEAGHDVTGYYLVGQDIDCGGKLFAAGYSYQKSFFKGIFDGNGKTISNFHIGAGGIFGGMQNAKVKDVSFEGVTMNGNVNDDEFWSNYTALFAHYAYGTTFEDINVEIVTINTARRNFPVQDGLFVEGYKAHCTFRNIVVDATDLTVENALGTAFGTSTNVTFENVTIYAGDVTRIGYVGTEQITVTGTDTDSDGKDDATGNTLDANGAYKTEGEYLTEWPAGVTYVKKVTNTALQYKKGGNVPVYDGDETDLGFAEGTTVYHYTAPAASSGDIWTVMGANGIKLTKSTFEDYASVQFVLGRDFTADSNAAFFSWIHGWPDNATTLQYAAGGWLYQNGSTGASSDANFSASANGFEFVVYDANGNLVTQSNPIKSGMVYTLYVYCDNMVDIELCAYAISGADMDIYFANPYSGNVKTDVMDEVVDISTGEFTLPGNVEGNVLSVSLGGKGIMSSAEGNTVVLNSAAAQLVAADLGKGKTLVVVTDKGYYEIEAMVVSKIITTAEELQALGVGGQTVDGVKQGQGNSHLAGNDVTGYYLLGDNIDASGIYFAAGYIRYNSYFKGTFDGNGHTISNVIVSEGGIFGGISTATIKNVNFVNVEYHDNTKAGQGYNNNQQWGQYFGLLAHFAASSKIENVNVQISALHTTSLGNQTGVLVYNWNGGSNVVTNVNVDASGLTFNNVLGVAVADAKVTFTNVNIDAAGYTSAMGYSDESGTALTGWPAGVNFTTVAENPNSYVIWRNKSAYVGNTEILPFYAGDVTALGFAEGTKVQYAEQDIRTSMWTSPDNVGQNRGLTAEAQSIKLTKTASYDYVSVQFALSRDLTAGSIFFAWCYDTVAAEGGTCTTLSVSKSTGTGSGGTITVQIYNLDGTVATNIVAGKAYEMRWYTTGDYRFQIACMENNGQPITVYYANPTVGNDA